MNINILGTTYKIVCDEEIDGADGLCDKSIKVIKICKTLFVKTDDPFEIQDKISHAKHVLMHEVVHAHHIESGFYGLDRLDTEHLVDWMAKMIPKINESMNGIKKEIDKWEYLEE